MLTGDLLLISTDKKQIKPRLIDPQSKRYLEFAELILAIVRAAYTNEKPRLSIEAEINDLCAGITDHKVVQGIAKMMLDRCEFELSALQEKIPISPYELRIEAFQLAQDLGPIAYQPQEGRKTAADIWAILAEKYECDAQQLRRFLYADRNDMQCITSLRDFAKPEDLLHRYNMGLCQAILLRSTQIQLRLKAPEPKMLRYLFQSIKFHRLMFSIETRGNDILIVLDGPQSLLSQSSRYGLQLANCFPIIPLFECEWSLHADLLWGKKHKFKKQMQLSSQNGLVSHYQKKGTWRSNAELWFEERFLALETDWVLEGATPIHLDDQNILVPDFSFRKDQHVVHMEIVGFWRKEYLEKRLAQCPNNMFLAVSRKLVSDQKKMTAKQQEKLILFAEIISAKEVVSKLNAFI